MPRRPVSNPSPGPPGTGSPKKLVTKIVSSPSVALPPLVTAMAVGFPPRGTVPTTVRLERLMATSLPSVCRATRINVPFGVTAQPRGSVPTGISATTLRLTDR